MSNLGVNLQASLIKLTRKRGINDMAIYGNFVQRDIARKASKRIEVVNGATSIGLLETVINDITDDSVRETTMTTEVSSVSGAGTGNLGRESVFEFTTTAGKILPFRLRGVSNSYVIAGSGGEIDITNADIVAFANAFIANARLSDGETATALFRAYVVD